MVHLAAGAPLGIPWGSLGLPWAMFFEQLQNDASECKKDVISDNVSNMIGPNFRHTHTGICHVIRFETRFVRRFAMPLVVRFVIRIVGQFVMWLSWSYIVYCGLPYALPAGKKHSKWHGTETALTGLKKPFAILHGWCLSRSQCVKKSLKNVMSLI